MREPLKKILFLKDMPATDKWARMFFSSCIQIYVFETRMPETNDFGRKINVVVKEKYL